MVEVVVMVEGTWQVCPRARQARRAASMILNNFINKL